MGQFCTTSGPFSSESKVKKRTHKKKDGDEDGGARLTIAEARRSSLLNQDIRAWRAGRFSLDNYRSLREGDSSSSSVNGGASGDDRSTIVDGGSDIGGDGGGGNAGGGGWSLQQRQRLGELRHRGGGSLLYAQGRALALPPRRSTQHQHELSNGNAEDDVDVTDNTDTARRQQQQEQEQKGMAVRVVQSPHSPRVPMPRRNTIGPRERAAAQMVADAERKMRWAQAVWEEYYGPDIEAPPEFLDMMHNAANNAEHHLLGGSEEVAAEASREPGHNVGTPRESGAASGADDTSSSFTIAHVGRSSRRANGRSGSTHPTLTAPTAHHALSPLPLSGHPPRSTDGPPLSPPVTESGGGSPMPHPRHTARGPRRGSSFSKSSPNAWLCSPSSRGDSWPVPGDEGAPKVEGAERSAVTFDAVRRFSAAASEIMFASFTGRQVSRHPSNVHRRPSRHSSIVHSSREEQPGTTQPNAAEVDPRPRTDAEEGEQKGGGEAEQPATTAATKAISPSPQQSSPRHHGHGSPSRLPLFIALFEPEILSSPRGGGGGGSSTPLRHLSPHHYPHHTAGHGGGRSPTASCSSPRGGAFTASTASSPNASTMTFSDFAAAAVAAFQQQQQEQQDRTHPPASKRHPGTGPGGGSVDRPGGARSSPLRRHLHNSSTLSSLHSAASSVQSSVVAMGGTGGGGSSTNTNYLDDPRCVRRTSSSHSSGGHASSSRRHHSPQHHPHNTQNSSSEHPYQDDNSSPLPLQQRSSGHTLAQVSTFAAPPLAVLSTGALRPHPSASSSQLHMPQPIYFGASITTTTSNTTNTTGTGTRRSSSFSSPPSSARPHTQA